MYEYHAQILSVHDGDTLTLSIDLGCSVFRRETIRLVGLNAPELATPAGKQTLAWLKRNIELVGGNDGWVVVTEKDRTEKYGRLLGTLRKGVWVMNDELLRTGNAVPYSGGKR